MSDDELDRLDALAQAATPGPWYVNFLDDDYAMNFVAVATTPDDGSYRRYPDFDAGALVAATLAQRIPRVAISDNKWDENAALIAASRTAIPALVAEVRRLRALVADPHRVPGHTHEYPCCLATP